MRLSEDSQSKLTELQDYKLHARHCAVCTQTLLLYIQILRHYKLAIKVTIPLAPTVLFT